MAQGSYQLWDLTTGNCAGAYDDEATALAEVRAGVAEDGPDSFEGVALMRSTGRNAETEDLGQGRALVARALAALKLPNQLGTTVHDMTEPLDPAERIPNMDVRGRGDVRITADGRRVVVEIDIQDGDDPIIGQVGSFSRRT